LNELGGEKSRWNRYLASGLTSGFFTYKVNKIRRFVHSSAVLNMRFPHKQENKGPFRTVKSFFTATTISFGSDQVRCGALNLQNYFKSQFAYMRS
jgi:hypothetical protein